MPLQTTLIRVEPADDGRTLQALIHDRAGVSHAEARGLIDAGAVRPLDAGPAPARRAGAAGEGRPPVRPGDYALRVRAGQTWEIRRDPGTRYNPKPAARAGRGYRVIHHDSDLLVVDKHPNLLTVPTEMREEEDSLVDRLLDAERQRGVRRPALYALHRLDRDTSGLLLFARTREAHDRLIEQFAERTIERLYTAVVEGTVDTDRGEFKSRLVEDPKSLKVHSTKKRGEGKEAVTSYEVTERLPLATVLSVRLRTGRKNQIRVHFSEAGHPLVGDRRYGRLSPLIGRTALHARALRFLHPRTGGPVTVESPLPRDLRALIKTLRRGRTDPPAER